MTWEIVEKVSDTSTVLGEEVKFDTIAPDQGFDVGVFRSEWQKMSIATTDWTLD